MKGSVNILQALRKERSDSDIQNDMVQQVRQWIHNDSVAESALLARMSSPQKPDELPESAGLDANRVFTHGQIRQTAIKYRLRFLPAHFFQGEIPAEALAALRRFQASRNVTATETYILAPGKRFRLTDGDTDPLLFAKLSDGRYYLIHQWGSDLSLIRRAAAVPFRSFASLLVTVLLISVSLALLMPQSLVNSAGNTTFWTANRTALFPYMFLLVSGIGLYFWFAFHRSLNEDQWESPHWN